MNKKKKIQLKRATPTIFSEFLLDFKLKHIILKMYAFLCFNFNVIIMIVCFEVISCFRFSITKKKRRNKKLYY